MTAVAVIVTCYNLGRFLEEAVDSAIGQTLAPRELLIVDDGSTDIYTQQTLVRLEARGHTVIRTPNRGVSAARNEGIRRTTAPYIVLLDADDVLDRTYLEKAAARLDADATLAFVSCAMRSFGAADETWTPPAPDLIDSMTRGVVHISSMFRRTMWEAVGGFDQTLQAHEEVDFWTTALEHGFRGDVLPEPLLNYRIRPSSMYQSAIRRDRHLQLMQRFYQKHMPALADRAEDLLVAKEAFIIEQRTHQSYLLGRKRELEAELDGLHRSIALTLSSLEPYGRPRVEFGDLRRTSPISPVWGLDRGIPLDRYYIHGFLDRHRRDIRGRVLEIKDSSYTRMFGGDRVSSAEVLDVDADNDQATIVADLTEADGIPADTYDCFILTQTLGLIYEARKALAHVARILKPGGVLLCTVPAAGRISYEGPALDGDYWRFTEASVRRMFAEVFPLDGFDVTGYGNVLACTAFLYGLAPEELSQAELDATDPFFPVIYGIRAVKSKAPAVLKTRGSTSASAAILMYHRVASDAADPYGLCVTPDEFRRHVQHLCERGCRLMSLQDLARCVEERTLPSGAVAITLDDGYLDGLTCASQVLRELSAPATFFIVGAPLDGQHEYWWDLLRRVFLSDHPLPRSLDVELPDGTLRVATATAEERAAARSRLSECFYTLSEEARNAAVRRILEWSAIGPPDGDAPRAVTAAELLELAACPGVAIGAHSESHLWLPTQDEGVRRREINANKERLERVLGRRITSFSYPYGGHDPRVVQLVREAGFTEAVTTEERLVTAAGDRFLLPRYEIKSGSNFEQRMDSIFGQR